MQIVIHLNDAEIKDFLHNRGFESRVQTQTGFYSSGPVMKEYSFDQLQGKDADGLWRPAEELINKELKQIILNK